jgi:hypothetical protein
MTDTGLDQKIDEDFLGVILRSGMGVARAGNALAGSIGLQEPRRLAERQ